MLHQQESEWLFMTIIVYVAVACRYVYCGYIGYRFAFVHWARFSIFNFSGSLIRTLAQRRRGTVYVKVML